MIPLATLFLGSFLQVIFSLSIFIFYSFLMNYGGFLGTYLLKDSTLFFCSLQSVISCLHCLLKCNNFTFQLKIVFFDLRGWLFQVYHKYSLKSQWAHKLEIFLKVSVDSGRKFVSRETFALIPLREMLSLFIGPMASLPSLILYLSIPEGWDGSPDLIFQAQMRGVGEEENTGVLALCEFQCLRGVTRWDAEVPMPWERASLASEAGGNVKWLECGPASVSAWPCEDPTEVASPSTEPAPMQAASWQLVSLQEVLPEMTPTSCPAAHLLCLPVLQQVLQFRGIPHA